VFVIGQIIAHRGASAYAPENTIAAFDQAKALGGRMIEFDVMLSADGEAFVFHDDALKRTTNGSGEFGLVTSEYLRSLDAGSWFSKQFHGEEIPTFYEVLKWLEVHNMQANIEIKPYPNCTEQTTLAVLSAINQVWPSDKKLPLISSFDRDALKLCRQMSPNMSLGLLLHHWDNNWQELAHELGCISVHLNKWIVTKNRINEIKEAGYKVCVYTVNSKRQAKKLFRWGVDAIFSDYPDLVEFVQKT